jgi:predicted nucleic acid-binding protein
LIYLDANLLVALCVAESASARVDAWLSRQVGQVIGTSQWALTETTSALGVKVRRRDMTREAAGESLRLLDNEIIPLLVLVDLPPTLFARAEILLRSFELGLRAGDALHLAICLDVDSSTLATADATLFSAARQLGQAAIKVY